MTALGAAVWSRWSPPPTLYLPRFQGLRPRGNSRDNSKAWHLVIALLAVSASRLVPIDAFVSGPKISVPGSRSESGSMTGRGVGNFSDA